MKGKIPTSPLRKTNQLLATGSVTIVIDTINNYISKYNSVRLAAKSLQVSHSILLKYIKEKKLLNNTYLVFKASP